MKRLACLLFSVLLLVAIVPVTVMAQTPTVSASYNDGVLSLAWDCNDPTTDYTLNSVKDEAGYTYNVTAIENSASIQVTLTAGTHNFIAFFDPIGTDDALLEVPFTVDVAIDINEAVNSFVVNEFSWDTMTKTVSVSWSALSGVTVSSVSINGIDKVVDNATGQFSVSFSELNAGTYSIQYVLNINGTQHTINDTVNTVICAGDISTHIQVEQNTFPHLAYVKDSNNQPIAGIVMHITAGTTIFEYVTDENGCVTLPIQLDEITSIVTDDLQTEYFLYKGSQWIPSSDSTSQSQQVIASTTNRTNSSTKRTSTSATVKKTTTSKRSTTTTNQNMTTTSATSSYKTYAGAATTGSEEQWITLNVLTDDNIVAAMQADKDALLKDSLFLVRPQIYASLSSESNGSIPMLSMLSSQKILTDVAAQAILKAELNNTFQENSVIILPMQLNVIYWDANEEVGIFANSLPNDEYVIRLPRTKLSETCNRFYVVDISADVTGDYIEAIVEPEYIQFTLSNLGDIAIVACEAESETTKLYIHPIVYIFFIVGGLLLIVAAVLIYFLFLHERLKKWIFASRTITDKSIHNDTAEDDIVYSHPELLEDELYFGEYADDADADIPQDGVSLGDIFNETPYPFDE